jgi:O-antigen/teichoic acid export membrane protein
VPGTLRRAVVGGHVALATAAGLAGVATYVLQLLVARVLGPQGFTDFAAFWAFVLIVSYGAFLPLEQDIARRTAGAPDRTSAHIWRAGSAAGAVLAALAAGGGLVAWRLGLLGSRDSLTLVAVLVVSAAGGAQFVARGVLAGTGRLHGYAAAVLLDALLRVVVIALVATWTDLTVGLAALVVAGSAVAAASVAVLCACRPTDTARPVPPRIRPGDLMSSVAALVAAAGALQLLLNSGPLVAKTDAGPAEGVLAGSLVAAMTLARIPVFVVQSVQPLYLPHVARTAATADPTRLGAQVRATVMAVGALATTSVVTAACIGPALLVALFGDDFDVGRAEATLVALGFALFVVALVCGDLTVAVGHPPWVARAWVAGLVVGGASLLVLDDLALRSTVPLALGSLTATVALGLAWRRRPG